MYEDNPTIINPDTPGEPDDKDIRYDEKAHFSCSGSGRIEKKFHLRHLRNLLPFKES